MIVFPCCSRRKHGCGRNVPPVIDRSKSRRKGNCVGLPSRIGTNSGWSSFPMTVIRRHAMQSSETRKILVTGLRNAHAMENQGLSIMKPQMRRIEHYPEVAAKLDQHIAETQGQIGRLEEILSNLNEDPSTLKDVTLSVARSI